jgi:large subunit ribosomal protein L21
MYAIVKTGGKQYRVEQGQSLLVERLSADDGAKVELEPLLYVDGSNVVDGHEGLSQVKVEAKVVAHERGPKLRVVKFKPKRGYKRRTGHRQELTRLEVTQIKLAARRSRAGTPVTAASEDAEAKTEAKPTAPRPVRAPGETAAKAKAKTEAKPRTPRTRKTPAKPKPTQEDSDGT